MENRSVIYSGIKKHQRSTNKIMKGEQDLYTESYRTLLGETKHLNK